MSLGLYLHIPYCFSKCRYCDFYSAPGQRGVPTQYVDALLRELARFAPDILPHGRALAGLFILPIALALPAVALAPRLCSCVGFGGDSVPDILCRIGGTALLYGTGAAAVCLPAVRYIKKGRKTEHDI